MSAWQSSCFNLCADLANFQQTNMLFISTICFQNAFAPLVPSLLTASHEVVGSTELLQVVPTTCHRLEVQQLV
jgi:hypothetical protein